MEDVAAYCRAVIDGDFIFMSGTMGVDQTTGKLPDSFPEQADNAFKIAASQAIKPQWTLLISALRQHMDQVCRAGSNES